MLEFAGALQVAADIGGDPERVDGLPLVRLGPLGPPRPGVDERGRDADAVAGMVDDDSVVFVVGVRSEGHARGGG